MSVKDWPWCWVTVDEAVLIAKTFTAAPAIVIFHRAWGVIDQDDIWRGGTCS